MADLISMPSTSLQTFLQSSELEFKKDRTEIDGYVVEIDRDPSKKSPAALYSKLHQAREFTNRAGVLYSKYLKATFVTSKVLTLFELEYNRFVNSIVSQHAKELTPIRSQDMQLRFCQGFIPEETQKRYELIKNISESYKLFYQYIKTRYDMIRDVKSDILTQLGILKAMMMLGELEVIGDFDDVKKSIFESDKSNEPSVGLSGEGEGSVSF